MPNPRTRLAHTLSKALGRCAWCVVAAGCVAALAMPSKQEVPRLLLGLMLGAFFVSVVLRLIVTAGAQPLRRRPLLVLGAGVALWASGSAVLAASGPIHTVTFPASGEWLFLASYAGLAAFLLLDVRRPQSRAAEVWLEAAVVCGGAACVAGFGLAIPAAITAGAGDVPVMLAYLYPTLDLILAVTVLSQLVLHQRDRSRRTAMLGTGFVVLALADSSFVFALSSGRYVSNAALYVAYATAFALVVGAASRPGRAVAPRPAQHSSRLLAVAAAVAVTVLVVRPGGAAGWYVVVPAIVTLLAAGGRLVLALREAQGAVEARQLSRTDDLTGLPNRRAILADLDVSLASDGPLGLMLVDLDGFKEINDSLGHTAGDALLTTIGQRLQGLVRSGDSVARLGGDEFALLVHDDDQVHLLEEAQRIRAALLESVVVDDLELAIRGTFGITVREPADTTATDLLRRADVAMYEAKTSRAGALLYDAARDGFSRQRLAMVEDLRRGIAEGQLVVWYQPQVDAATSRPSAVEALVRWQHPEQGLLPPVAFLPDARRAGLMLALTEAVVRMVVADARKWLDQGFDFRVSFNCAPPELLGGALLPKLFDAIASAQLPPQSLLVEVTEDSFLSDPMGAREALLALRDHHVQAAIDDYGTGFSSLAYLRDLPVQELKIDRSFASTVLSDPRSRVIVDSTNRMAAAMGLRLVAEGVEDAAVAAELSALGVGVLQGYHIAKPMPAQEVVPWMRSWSAVPDYHLVG